MSAVATSHTTKSSIWAEKLIPLLIIQAVIFLLFRPLLANDLHALMRPKAAAAPGQIVEQTMLVFGIFAPYLAKMGIHLPSISEAAFNFGADLLCYLLAFFTVCLIIFDRMGPIAINTFKEAVRNRILYFILLFALILMGSSGIIKELAVGAHDRVIRDLGLASISFFGLMVAIFVGISLVYTELDKKSIYTIVSKPLHRYQYLLGKFFGLLLTIYIIVGIMTLFFFVVVNYQALTTDEIIEKVIYTHDAQGYHAVANMGWVKAVFLLKALGHSIVYSFGNIFGFAYGAVTQNLMIQIAMTCIELMIVTAFAILYSSFSTPTLSAVFTVMTFLAGRLNEDIMRFGMQILKNGIEREGVKTVQELSMGVWIKYQVVHTAAMIVPNLDSINMSHEALSDTTMQVWRFPVLYAICYTGAILMVAVLIFRRRNFK